MGPGAVAPKRVGRVSPLVGPGPCVDVRTGAAGGDFRVRGGNGSAVEGVRGWRRELQMVRASVQNVEIYKEGS